MKNFLLFFLSLIIPFSLFSQSPSVIPENISAEEMQVNVYWNYIKKLPINERPRIILVLGGGGARGLAHIGVIRVFEEEGIFIDEISGVSVGSLIGSLYAAGLPVNEIETMANDIGWNKLTDYSKASFMRMLLTEELLSTAPMEAYLKKHIGNKFFSELEIPFSCVATDIRTGEKIVFKEGPVAIAARASATIPALFKPVQYRQRLLVDGGLVDNLPTDIALPQKDWDVVVGVLPITNNNAVEPTSIFGSLIRSIDIQKDVILSNKKRTADVMIEPPIENIRIVDLNKSADLIRMGTLAARKMTLDIKKAVIRNYLSRKS
ncbi:MAG: patatin-like phospholipase family protein [Elusimicrobiota bacterium]